MNIAIGRKTFGRNSWFGFGLLLAAIAAAVVLAGVWQATSSRSSQTVVEPAAGRPVEPASRAVTPVHYYLIDSLEQAELIAQASFEAQFNYSGVGTAYDQITQVIDVSTPAGQAHLRSLDAAITEDKLSGGIGLDVIDLRVGPLTGGVSASSTPARSGYTPSTTPAQATIYIVGSEAEKLALLQEADEAAAVEGGDNTLPSVVVIDRSDPEALQLEEAITEDRLNGGIGARVMELR